MAESDTSMDPLAHPDALRDDAVVAAAAVSAPLDCVDEPEGQRWEEEEDEDQGDGTLLELFSLIAEVDVVDEDASDDSLVGVVGEKRSLSTPSAADSPANEPQATTRKMKKRRYQEVIRMRQTAAELERQLDALKSRQTNTENRLRHEGRDAGVYKWQRAATKEIQATARAKLENAKLKENVEAQTEFLSSLQEALAKRQYLIEELQQLVVPSHRSDFTVARRPRSAKESEIYGLLIKNIYARACELDEVFRINVLADIQQSNSLSSEPDATTMNVLLNDEEALSIDLIDGYVIPFDFQAGARVLWTHVLSKQLEMTDTSVQTEVIVTTDDVLLTKQTANSNFLIQDHELTTEYSISKRVCDSNCVSFVWESITESKGAQALTSQGTPAIQLVQKGCVKVKPLATANGSSAASLQAYVRLSPSTIRADSDEANAGEEEEGQRRLHNHQQFDVKVLTAHIVSSYRHHAGSIRRFLENTLIDEMLSGASSSSERQLEWRDSCLCLKGGVGVSCREKWICFARRTPAFYLSQYGCAQTIRVHDKSLDGRLPASLIQPHGRLVVLIQMEAACNQARDQFKASKSFDSGVFIDMMTASNQQNAQTFLYLVENALVEELVTQDTMH